MSDALAVRQNFSEALSSQHISEGGLRQQAGGEVSIGNIGHGRDGITDAEVDHSIHTNGNRIFGEDLEEKCIQQLAESFESSNLAYTIFVVAFVHDSTSWGGMSNEMVRRSTFTKESVHGKIKKIPVDKNK